jgi:7-carboxy-7-deazaguanine synthase
MIVNEIFYSLQGEGFLVGVPSVFIRLAGCPLRCKWCDTKYAWDYKAGQDYDSEEIIRRVQQYQCKYIVITGGEPMTNPDLPALTRKLRDNGKHITIETAGITFVPKLACDLMSISPKLSNSGNNSALDLAVLNDLIDSYNYQLKFVVDSADDLPEIKQVLSKLNNIDFSKVMLMPQAATRDELLAKSPMVADLCKQNGFAFCPRLQILLWDNKKGT